MSELKEERRVEKTRGHQIYRLQDGSRVPGCTTIIGVMDKPHLVPWANRLGLEGISTKAYTDVLKDTGTLAHALVQADLEGWEVDTSEFSQDQISDAETAFLKWLEFKARHSIELLGSEMQLASEEHRYGGTLDAYVLMDGEPMLIDFKTGKKIYDEYSLQLTGLRMLLSEHGQDVGSNDRNAILRLGRTASEGFEFRQMELTNRHWKMFKALLTVYELRKEIW